MKRHEIPDRAAAEANTRPVINTSQRDIRPSIEDVNIRDRESGDLAI
jgi:hypothetical protein